MRREAGAPPRPRGRRASSRALRSQPGCGGGDGGSRLSFAKRFSAQRLPKDEGGARSPAPLAANHAARQIEHQFAHRSPGRSFRDRQLPGQLRPHRAGRREGSRAPAAMQTQWEAGPGLEVTSGDSAVQVLCSEVRRRHYPHTCVFRAMWIFRSPRPGRDGVSKAARPGSRYVDQRTSLV